MWTLQQRHKPLLSIRNIRILGVGMLSCGFRFCWGVKILEKDSIHQLQVHSWLSYDMKTSCFLHTNCPSLPAHTCIALSAACNLCGGHLLWPLSVVVTFKLQQLISFWNPYNQQNLSWLHKMTLNPWTHKICFEMFRYLVLNILYFFCHFRNWVKNFFCIFKVHFYHDNRL